MAKPDKSIADMGSADDCTLCSKPPREPLRAYEVVIVVSAVVAGYGGFLCMLHSAFLLRTDRGEAVDAVQGFWHTLPSAWDHPEPNYLMSGAIGEFWSTLTTIPVAGALLLYNGLRFRYGNGFKVLAIYVLVCMMYTLAFSAHLSLQRHVFSVTVISVMNNALLTFAQFSYVVHPLLHSKAIRGCIVVLAEIALVSTVVTLPYALAENGGVWTLFVVQTPGVFFATFLATYLAAYAKEDAEKATFRLVSVAGSLLSSAMVLSFAECLIGFQHGFLPSFWGFPWLHIVIHVLEQVGIYIFGIGVATMDALLLRPHLGKGEVRYLGKMVYFYCDDVDMPASASPSIKPAKKLAANEVNGAMHRLNGHSPSTFGTDGRSEASAALNVAIGATGRHATSYIAASPMPSLSSSTQTRRALRRRADSPGPTGFATWPTS